MIIGEPKTKCSYVTKVCDVCGLSSQKRYVDVIRSRDRFGIRSGVACSKDYCYKCSMVAKMTGDLAPTKSDDVRFRISETHKRLRPRNPDGLLDKRGYKLVYSEDTKQYINEHRLVVSEAIGRKLTSIEEVHHIDGEKLNNHISNLHLCANTREHMLIHSSLEAAAFSLVRSGVIGFDQDKKEYYVK